MSQINLWSMCTVTCGDLEKILHLEEEGTFCLLLMITPEECRLKFLNQTIKHLIDLRNGTLKLQIRRNLSRSILELIMDWSSYLRSLLHSARVRVSQDILQLEVHPSRMG